MDDFKTYDLCLAATLMCLGHELKKTNVEVKRLEFVFDKFETEQTIKDFRNFKLKVVPQELHYKIKSLKSLVYST